jgi:HSP20 family protein
MMLLRNWHPIQDMMAVQEEINRIFNEALGTAPLRQPEAASATAWSPRLDMAETDDAFVVYVDLPGVKPDAVEVMVEDNSLIIKGSKPAPEPAQGETVHRAERSRGDFYRSLPLPTSVDPGAIKASLKDGVLEVRLGKAAQARPRRIEITSD